MIQEEIAEMIKEIDEDSNGEIDFEGGFSTWGHLNYRLWCCYYELFIAVVNKLSLLCYYLVDVTRCVVTRLIAACLNRLFFM